MIDKAKNLKNVSTAISMVEDLEREIEKAKSCQGADFNPEYVAIKNELLGSMISHKDSLNKFIKSMVNYTLKAEK